MTDKEKKSKIADILLEFYDEYQCNMLNRPMIPSLYASKIIDSLQEEPTTSVWHDANILPSNPKAVIVEHNEYSTSICRAEQMSRIKGAKWAYVEDLLKL